MSLFSAPCLVVEKDTDGSVFLKIDVPDRKLNVVTKQFLDDLEAALARLEQEKNLPVLIVRSGKSTGFLAGADLHEFAAIRNSAEATAISKRGQAVFARLAALPIPTVAAISGPCLGGGLELALACDYRLVFDRPDTQLGLPEVELGLLPGWGGTQRLPRAVGLERALQMILGARRLKAREALAWGLADALAVGESDLRQKFAELTAKAMTQGKRQRTWLPGRTWRQWLLESNPFGRRIIFRVAERNIARRVPEDMPAPAEALEAVRVGLKKGMEVGFEQEREAAGRLAVSPACRNLVGLFLGREEARKLPAELARQQPPRVGSVGVVGAGVMGAGIAQLAAIRGCKVIVQEINDTALGAGVFRIQELFQKAVQRGLLSQVEANERISNIRGTTTWEGFRGVDVVIEAAIEDLTAKRGIFKELESQTRPETILATNTSSLRVAALQEGAAHPERIAGLHFFNPVHRMPLVELVRGPATGDGAAAQLFELCVMLGKTPVIVRDSPGFVVNRILMPYLYEAVLLVGEGLGIGEVDRVMKRFGMPMGPLELLDQVGLDVAAHVAASMQPLLTERFPPTSAFEQMKASGWLGQKSGKGFYIHSGKKTAENPLAANLLRSLAPASESALAKALSRTARLSEARERMVLLMVNEAALVLSEQLADAGAIDLAMVLGTGWAPHRGGPLHYADQRGLVEVVQALRNLADRHGRRFALSTELFHRYRDGRNFFPGR
jgi:3-hydroxyacyl-CoA dehydrogenase/enoyl-CoA hydratase/3-hydroxybutyryl-CoA epimerase